MQLLVRLWRSQYKALECRGSSENLCPSAPGTLCWKGCLCLLPQFCLGNVIFQPSAWDPGTCECWHRPRTPRAWSQCQAGLTPLFPAPLGDILLNLTFQEAFQHTQYVADKLPPIAAPYSEQEDHKQRPLGSWILQAAYDMCRARLVIYGLQAFALFTKEKKSY